MEEQYTETQDKRGSTTKKKKNTLTLRNSPG